MTRASPSTSASTRRRRQPTARKMPISRVRSKIDMSIVLSMPTEPRIRATAAVVQAMARASRIWVSLWTWSRAGVAATPAMVGLDPMSQLSDELGIVGSRRPDQEAR